MCSSKGKYSFPNISDMILFFCSSHPIQFIVVPLNNCYTLVGSVGAFTHMSKLRRHGEHNFSAYTGKRRKKNPKNHFLFPFTWRIFVIIPYFLRPSHSTVSPVSKIFFFLSFLYAISSMKWWKAPHTTCSKERGGRTYLLLFMLFNRAQFSWQKLFAAFVCICACVLSYWVTTSREIENFSFNMIYSLCLGFFEYIFFLLF